MNAFYFTQRTGARLMAAVALLSLIAGLVPMQAFAAAANPINTSGGAYSQQTNIKICHTGNGTNFIVNSPNVDSIIDGNNSGHGGSQHEQDIIPAFYYKSSGNQTKLFPGKNWTLEGNDRWQNGTCNGDGVLPKSVNIGVTKIANDTTPDIGQTVTYTLVVSNTGPDGATNVVLTDNVPAGTTFVSATPAQTGAGPYTWNLGSIANGTSKTVTVAVTVNSATGGQTITNTASVVATESDSNTSNNTVTEDIVVNNAQVRGCTDPEAFNYNPAATEDNGSCVPVVLGCTDEAANNYNPAANTDNASCDYEVYGCTNPAANNYEADATVDDDSCTFDPVPGCTDSEAFNYNPAATEDNGSCVPVVLGCTDEAANNYEAGANTNDDSCTYDVLGCTNPLASNYNALANEDDGSCVVPPVPGCTEPTANNYNPAATVDNGSCDYGDGDPDPIYGCTDDSAVNYSSRANTDDDSCIYDYQTQCIGGVEAENLLANPSFEESVGLGNNAWGIFTNVPSWTHTLSTGIEVWNNLLITPSNGIQNVELDGEDATKITQTVANTVAGNVYELRFDFAARSADSADNHIEAAADGVSLVNQSTDYTNWVTYGGTFTADGPTDISFVDLGTVQEGPAGTGTLLDNAVLCLVREAGDNNERTYRIQGYAWYDDNRNTEWDGLNDEEEGNEEGVLSGWTIKITNGDGDNRETTTDENGFYYFDVPAGTWTITEEVEDGWMRTTQESYTVTVPDNSEDMTLLDSVMDFIIPTAHAADVIVKIDAYGDYNFGNDRRGGGGGGGNSAGDRDDDDDRDGEVLGDSDDREPVGAVLGEQVDAVPTGAPNTGKGGSASTIVLSELLATPRRRNHA